VLGELSSLGRVVGLSEGGFVPIPFAKTLADLEINDLATLPPLFCYI
jgi:hypothetical protein